MKKILFSILFLISFYTENAIAQSNSNPFEVRIVNDSSKNSVFKKDSLSFIRDSNNPFEIIHVPENYQFRDTLKITKTVPIISYKTKNQNFLFVVLSILLFFFAILISLNRSLLINLYQSVLSETLLKLAFRVQNNSQTLSYFLFYLFYFFNAGLFIFLMCSYYKIKIAGSDFGSYFVCILSVIAIYLFKHFILFLIGYIFPVKKEINYYNFMLIAFNIILGICLLPINGLISFAPEYLSKILLYIGMGLWVLFYGIRQLRGMLLAGNFIADQKFHFFIYLCAIEIAPILILTKLILTTL